MQITTVALPKLHRPSDTYFRFDVPVTEVNFNDQSYLTEWRTNAQDYLKMETQSAKWRQMIDILKHNRVCDDNFWPHLDINKVRLLHMMRDLRRFRLVLTDGNGASARGFQEQLLLFKVL